MRPQGANPQQRPSGARLPGGRTNHGLSRRELLSTMSTGFGMTALSALMADPAYAGLAATPGPHHTPTAKNVVFLFMSGGVSHMDTFDPKPKLAELNGTKATLDNYTAGPNRKWLGSPWKFKQHGQSGAAVSELFPHVATCVDDLAIVRSMKSDFPLHPRSNIKLHTGRNVGGYPSLGSWITYGLGTENRDLPGYVLLDGGAVPPGGVENFSSGFLPASHQATSVAADGVPIHNLAPADMDLVQRAKLDAIIEQDRLLARSQGGDAIESAIRNYELAYRMQSLLPDVLDLSRENAETKRNYGLEAEEREERLYGTQCLRARRLIEAGVRFVEITCAEVYGGNNGTWDQHTDLKKGHEGNARITDRPVAALVSDLKARGMLDETLVVWATEFGRTPDTGNGDGRDHHETGFTIWMAGGGARNGLVYGNTDELGVHAVEDVMTVHDLHATILHLAGLDHERLTYRFGGRDISLTDVHGRVVHDLIG